MLSSRTPFQAFCANRDDIKRDDRLPGTRMLKKNAGFMRSLEDSIEVGLIEDAKMIRLIDPRQELD